MTILEQVTFDLDGTLADAPFERLVLPHVYREMERLGIATPQERLFQEQLRRFDEERRVDAFHWDDLVLQVLRAEGVDASIVMAELMERADVAKALREEKLFPDVIAGLRAIRALGFGISVLTNGHARYQRAVFAKMGVDTLFDVIVGPDVLGISKPNPAVFTHESLKLPVRMHVGDLLTQDVAVAKGAGIRGVMVARPRQTVDGFERLRAYSPAERPRAALASGLLLQQYEKEHRYLARPLPPAPLTSESDAFPDAIVFSIEELPDLLRTP
ncbi:HAD family hydrolase [Ferroacidibacillus organovorans]|uniref:Haloacid dehalogenase n=2 Tax=Ferroacidibacillus organovorans TaxID=1765683 RepID=A0A1V4ESB5_9BACL|nr:HAD family hydrolase [Ferroacidibacillus organovorans]OPG15823.1 hypothetical protein B2M26_09420 [Ferroacidibacillus organovorans]